MSSRVCSSCGGRGEAKGTRDVDGRVYRRRACLCGVRWSTYEVRESELAELERDASSFREMGRRLRG